LEHSEQVQRVTLAGASLTSNCVLPQWQLPLMVMASPAPKIRFDAMEPI
jgi:hypothetical protein